MLMKLPLCRLALLGAAIIAPVLINGCAAHVSAGYRGYDPYYSDYQVWGPDEDVYYHRWIGERHYDYKDFRQKEYWTWRHAQAAPHP